MRLNPIWIILNDKMINYTIILKHLAKYQFWHQSMKENMLKRFWIN